MSEKNLTLIEAIEKGKIEDINSNFEKIVETLLSKLYFFKDKVIKIYKHKKNSLTLVDLADENERRRFYAEDFSWNNLASPKTYTKLQPMKIENAQWIKCKTQEAQDFYIEMNRIDEEITFTQLLQNDEIDLGDMKKAGELLVRRLISMTHHKKHEIDFSIDFKEKLLENYEFLTKFILENEDFVSKQTTIKFMNYLKELTKKNKYFDALREEDLVVSIDNHSDNVLWSKGELSFIDILLPQEKYRISDMSFNLARLGVGIKAIGSIRHAKEFYQGARELIKDTPEEVIQGYELMFALGLACYNHKIKNDTISQKYLSFFLNEFNNIQNSKIRKND